LINCPIIHYQPDKERVLKTHIFSRFQNRNELPFRRKSKNQFQAILDQNIISEVAGFIQNDYWRVALAYDLGDEQPTYDNNSESSRSETPQRSDSRNSRVSQSHQAAPNLN
jgi:hypothetical protein